MCGDHLYLQVGQGGITGSPPHVRGPLLNPAYVLNSAGITPACAGTTIVITKCFLLFRDHPRMCGDHVYIV